MATFDVWSRANKRIDGQIELTKDDISTMKEVSCRTGEGPSAFRTCCEIVDHDGLKSYIACPLGELEDRLNDADASAPESDAFNPDNKD